MRIVGYIFNADIFCPDCIFPQLTGSIPMYPVETELDDYAKLRQINRQDERTFDSSDFPKVIFSTQLEHREFCGSCEKGIK